MNGNDEASFKTLKRVTTQDHLRNLFPEDVSKPEELTKARLPIMRQDVMMSLRKVWPMPREHARLGTLTSYTCEPLNNASCYPFFALVCIIGKEIILDLGDSGVHDM